jgi:hypothetical protein
VLVKEDYVALAFPRRVQQVDAAEAVGGGGEEAEGGFGVVAEEGVFCARDLGLGGDLGFDLIHAGEERLHLVEVELRGGVLCRALEVGDGRDAVVQRVDGGGKSFVFLGFLGQEFRKASLVGDVVVPEPGSQLLHVFKRKRLRLSFKDLLHQTLEVRILRIAGFAVLRLTFKHFPLVAHRGAGEVWAEGLFEPGVVARLGDQGAGEGLECRQDCWGSILCRSRVKPRVHVRQHEVRVETVLRDFHAGRGCVFEHLRKECPGVFRFVELRLGEAGGELLVKLLGESGEVGGLGEPCFGLQGRVAAKGDCGGAGWVRAHGNGADDQFPCFKRFGQRFCLLPQGDGDFGAASTGGKGWSGSPSFHAALAMQRH